MTQFFYALVKEDAISGSPALYTLNQESLSIAHLVASLRELHPTLHAEFEPQEWSLWRWMDGNVHSLSNLALGSLDLENSDVFQSLCLRVADKVSVLGLVSEELLLLRAGCDYPNNHPLGKRVRPPGKPLYTSYAECILQLDNGTIFSNATLIDNGIECWDTGATLPHFVERFQEDLQRKRKALPQYANIFYQRWNKESFEKLYTLEQDSGPASHLDSEMVHMLRAVSPAFNTLPNGWREPDAHSVLFYDLAMTACRYFRHRFPSYGFTNASWPYNIVCYDKNAEHHRLYNPTNDFILSFSGMPVVIAEIDSEGDNEADRYRMLCQGGTAVRLVNQISARNGGGREFVLMAIYFKNSGEITVYHLFQNRGAIKTTSNTVYYVEQVLGNNPDHRATLVHQLYNLLSHAIDFKRLNAVEGKWAKIVTSAGCLVKLTKKGMKRPNGDDPAGLPPFKKLKTGGGANDFEADGYECLETLSNRPGAPYVFVVRNLKDGQKYVAKVNRNQRERHILEHLGGIQTNRIIQLLETFSSNLGETLLLPLRTPVVSLMASEAPGEVFDQFAMDLIEGLAFIHAQQIAHRDIKPDNLVYTDQFRLEIIDFDIAIKVRDVDDMVEDDVGTEGYRAPETADRNGCITPYSPIRADRWSCGRTIQRLVECIHRWDHPLLEFADRLVDEDPEARPSLEEWAIW